MKDSRYNRNNAVSMTLCTRAGKLAAGKRQPASADILPEGVAADGAEHALKMKARRIRRPRNLAVELARLYAPPRNRAPAAAPMSNPYPNPHSV